MAEGIPEPSITYYGTIRNTAVNNQRLTSGTLTWQIRKVSTGRTVTVTTPLGNYPGFSYVLELPCETIVSGPVSTNALDLSATSVSFDRSQVFYQDSPASFVISTQSTFTASSRVRGRIERLDLLVSISCQNIDGNEFCDDWEMNHFGYIGVDPYEDYDRDGMSNLAEYRAGSDPADPNSVFQFITYESHSPNGMKVEWESADGRSYALLRTTNVFNLVGTNLASRVGMAVVRSNLVATPPRNTFIDSNAVPPGPYFYRLELEQ